MIEMTSDGEYVKKSDILNELGDINMDILTDEVKEIVNGLQTYTFPDSAKTDKAKPDEGAELIDRRQIKWYGCDHEGHIKGINCDTADCSKCFFATVEHDEVMSLPVYRIPDSAENKGDTVSRSAYEQIMWERDTAVQQLKDLGYGLGEKPKENKGESEEKS